MADRKDRVNILGTDYKIIEDNNIIADGYDGVCNYYDKTIKIRPMECMLSDSDTAESKTRRYKEVLRHEIIHAFFDESGLDEYSQDELLVQWLASQIIKIIDAYIGVV